MEIYLIRHTPMQVDKSICYGQSNVEVATTFDEDAKAIKEKLPTDFDEIYCSPLTRCTKLAQALNFSSFKQEEALLEMNFGDWENKAWNDINETELNNWMGNFVHVKTPNGENLQIVYDRVESFLQSLRNNSSKKILLITHAGVIRCVWSFLLDIPLQNVFKIPVGFGEIMIFKLGENKLFDSIKQMM